MLRTPEILQQKYGVPAEAGRGRAFPRVWFSYSGADKFRFLVTVMSMTVRGTLPEQGQRRLWSRPVTQEALGASCGVTRETFTRRLSEFAPVVDSSKRRRCRSPRELLSRRRRFAMANAYAWLGLPESRVEWGAMQKSTGEVVHNFFSARAAAEWCNAENKKAGREKFVPIEGRTAAECYHAPTIEALQADPARAAWWSREFSTFARGYKDVPAWVWDARVPLSDTARLVFSFYVCCGLLDKAGASIKGEVHPKQETAAAACGISTKSVRRANLELAGLGLIRVAASDARRDEYGNWRRGPKKIIYLPTRQLSTMEAEAERARYWSALRSVPRGEQFDTAATVFRALLDAWQGKEHCIRAFWSELWRQLIAAGVQRKYARILVPKPPE